MRPQGVSPREGASPVTRWRSCGEAWIGLLRHVLDRSRVAPDDRGPVYEGVPALFEISAICRSDPVLLQHGQPALIAQYDRKFTQDTVFPPFKYSYGARLRCVNGADQLAWVTSLLLEHPHSKSAWITLTLPGEQPRAVPCLAALAFRAREERLHLSAIFRSQNAFTAYLNYLPLRDVQSEIAGRLGLPCGLMRVYIDVPHVYVDDAPKARQILSARTGTDVIANFGVPGLAG